MINKEPPYIMHIDLNCCFAIIEQQANRLLRGRPVAVSAYGTARGMVLASSYEAKRLGVKLGVNNQQARQLAPGIVILTPDPPKYREAHRRFKELLLDYTPDVVPKSIDEFVLNFDGSLRLKGLTFEQACAEMERIGHEIKARVRESLGEWVTVNIGIGTNRFLAKYGAGFNKPDGLTLITHKNLHKMYAGMALIDLPGINVRYASRLMACGIHTPLEFLDADVALLKKIVFKSVVGYYWWARLRGHEVDNRTFATKSIGHQYALPHKTDDRKDLARLLMKLCEKVGRRVRKKNYCARGVHLYLGFSYDYTPKPGASDPIGFESMHRLRSWHEGHRVGYRLYATSEIYEASKYLLEQAVIESPVRIMAITVYDLEPWDPEQLTIFDQENDAQKYYHEPTKASEHVYMARTKDAVVNSKKRLSDAMDAINNRYGEFVVTPGTMIDMKGEILDRIAFGSTEL